MGVVDAISTTQLIANMVAQEGNLYAAARVHQRRLDTAVAVEPTTTSLALAVLSMRSTDTSPQRTLALQVHHSTWPMPEAWPLEHVAAVVGEVIEHPMMVDDAVDDPPLALVAPAMMDAHAYPALPLNTLSLSDRDSMDGMSNTHPRLLQTHDGLAADVYIHHSAIPHAGVGLHTRRKFNVGEPIVCMRRPMHVRSWKDADAWVTINELKGADIVIRLNSRSFFLDEAVPEFGDSYDHCPWRAVNDAHREPSNIAWQIFREKPGTGSSWRLVPVLVATRAIAEGEELLREYSDVQYRSRLPPASELVGDLEEDAPWVHAALDHLALECQEELDDLLPPRSFIPSSPTSLSDTSTSSSVLIEPMEDSDFISAASAHFQNAGFAFCARTEPGSSANAHPSAYFISGTSAHLQNAGSAFGARTGPGGVANTPPANTPLRSGVANTPPANTPPATGYGSFSSASLFPTGVGNARVPHTRRRRSRRWPARILARANSKDLYASERNPLDCICSSSARATSSGTLQDTSTHVLAWCIVMIPLVCHSVAIWMEVITPGVLLLLRVLSLLVIVVVPAVGIFTLCSVRATEPVALQDAEIHVLAWCLVMFPLVCHSVAIWMEVVHPGVLLLLRLLSMMVIVMVPAVGIFTLCDGRRITSSSVSSSATSRCTRPLRTSRCHSHSMSGCGVYPATPATSGRQQWDTADVTARASRSCDVKRVLLLFAGPKRKDDIGSCLRFAGVPVTEFDLVRGDDLLDDGTRAGLMRAARGGSYGVVFAAPPCSTFSVARLQYSHGPPQLRSRMHPRGMPGLPPSDADHVERHNLLVQYMIELMSAAKSSGAAIAVENPVPRGNPESPFYQTGLSDHSSLWDLPEMVKMMSSFYMISVDFPQCALHADFQKYTRVAFTPTLRPMLQRLASLRCVHKNHAAIATRYVYLDLARTHASCLSY